jgi:uncharacterized membrane protein YdjX (TVP38/TMEM64 family)
VIDEHFLRIGSGNLNNRSMGVDTECDLAIEASSDAERATIAAIRNRLLGEHCGVDAHVVADELARRGSLVAVADSLAAGGHCLRPIVDGRLDRNPVSALIERIADPMRPPQIGRWTARLVARLLRPNLPVIAGVALLLLMGGLTLAWHFTDLGQITSPERLGQWLSVVGNRPWTVAIVVLAFVLAGAVAVPVNLLILGTAAAFGPWWGALYSALGALASALAMYWAGAHFGKEPLHRLLGERWRRALDGIRTRGIVAVVGLRLVPVAPFTLVNLAAGAGGVRFADFVLGTVIGMAPGLGLLAVMGDRVARLLSHPSASELGMLAVVAALWIGLAFSAQAFLARRGDRAS